MSDRRAWPEHADSLDWASAELGVAVVDVVPLAGGFTSTMLALTDEAGGRAVLRLMTEEPWRTHGAELVAREQAALRVLATTPVPAPTTIALDATGRATGVAAHLTTLVPGRPSSVPDDRTLAAMAATLAVVHAVRPASPFRDYESWAWEAKRVVPPWTAHPGSWARAFARLAEPAPSYAPTFLHRDFGHRNLLWLGDEVSGVVDWVETSTGPAWLDAGHAATNLAVAYGAAPARAFLAGYAELAAEPADPYWLVLDAVGFLPPPGRPPMFAGADQLARLDAWLHELVVGAGR